MQEVVGIDMRRQRRRWRKVEDALGGSGDKETSEAVMNEVSTDEVTHSLSRC